MKRRFITTVLLVTLAALLLAGCGGGFNPYKELDVDKKNVPEYNLTSELQSSKDGQKIVYAIVEENFDQEKAKKSIAHYIDQHKEDQDLIIIHVMGKDTKYSAEYQRTAKAYEVSPNKGNIKKPAEFPAIIFNAKEKKK